MSNRYCFACDQYDAVLRRASDGHSVVTCRKCGAERGPFISMYDRDEPQKEVQSGLGDFA